MTPQRLGRQSCNHLFRAPALTPLMPAPSLLQSPNPVSANHSIPQIRMKDLVKILKAVPEAEIRAKQRAVMDVRRRFSWQSAVKRTHGGRNQGKPGADGRVSADTDYREHDGRRDALGVPPAEDPSGPFAFDTDTFGTIMQILAFKARAAGKMCFR